MKRSRACIVTLAASFFLSMVAAFAQEGRGLVGGTGIAPTKEGSRAAKEIAQSRSQPTKGTGNAAEKTTASYRLTQNPQLSSRLQRLLPAGTDLQETAKDFQHLAEFVSVVHVSYNLRIPFDELKAKLMSGKDLREAILELRPGVIAGEEIIKANAQAREDLMKSASPSPNSLPNPNLLQPVMGHPEY